LKLYKDEEVKFGAEKEKIIAKIKSWTSDQQYSQKIEINALFKEVDIDDIRQQAQTTSRSTAILYFCS